MWSDNSDVNIRWEDILEYVAIDIANNLRFTEGGHTQTNFDTPNPDNFSFFFCNEKPSKCPLK